MFEIHESARENFDKKANELIGLITIQNIERKKSRNNTDIHIAANLTDKDILNFEMHLSDYNGNVVGRSFVFDGKKYAIEGDNYQKVILLAESIKKIKTFKELLSRSFIEKQIFKWLELLKRQENIESSFLSYLISTAMPEVKCQKIYIPLAHTIVEQPFEFCGVIIQSITKQMAYEMCSNSNGSNTQKKSNEVVEKLIRQLQGYATLCLDVTCEPSYTKELVLEKSKQITDLLGIFSIAVLLPDLKCPTRIKGTENIEEYTLIRKSVSNNYSYTFGIIDEGSSRIRELDRESIEKYAACGLFKISDLYLKEQLSNFERAVLSMAFLYSKAAFTKDPMEKLIYMLSALESTFLKTENEPIQQNLAERLALFIGDNLKQRKEIIKNIKFVYGLRSRYLHHGNSSNEMDELSKFFMSVWECFVKLVLNSSSVKTKDEFLNILDDKKLS